MLGTETGASVFDFTGAIRQAVEDHLRRDPRADFETLQRLYFADEEGRIRVNQISPRCFEAAALRTLLILYEGEYSGLLTPWRHYVPLKKDYSNLDEVLATLRNPSKAQHIVDTAYDEVARNPTNSYAGFVKMFDQTISEMVRPGVRTEPLLNDRDFAKMKAPSRSSRRRMRARRIFIMLHHFVFSFILGRTSAETRDYVELRLKAILRPVQTLWRYRYRDRTG
jgi:hypothetical protein